MRTNGNRSANQAPSEVVRGEVAGAKVYREGCVGLALRDGTAVMGTVLGFDKGDHVEARGKWSEDPKWGRRFKAQTITRVLGDDDRGAIAWLSSRLPGLGEVRARELVKRFGIPELYRVIEREPELLTEVRGITRELAEKIRDAHAAVKCETEEMTQLLGWGLTDSQIKRCREAWGKDVIPVLREDPYRLAEEVHGFGFKRADDIARRMGLPADHPRRLQACCLHMLREAETEGECYVPRGLLLKVALEELAAATVRIGQVAEQLDALVEESRVAQVEHHTGEVGRARVYLPDTRAAELAIAARVRRMLGGGRAAV